VREARFIVEYLRDANAKEAATRAGYSAKTARVIGSELLHKPHIATAISARMTGETTAADARCRRCDAKGAKLRRVVERLRSTASLLERTLLELGL